MSNVDKQMNICFDHKAPSIVIEIEEYRNGYVAWAVYEGEELSHNGILKRTTRSCSIILIIPIYEQGLTVMFTYDAYV
jgi:hypothetical protein